MRHTPFSIDYICQWLLVLYLQNISTIILYTKNIVQLLCRVTWVPLNAHWGNWACFVKVLLTFFEINEEPECTEHVNFRRTIVSSSCTFISQVAKARGCRHIDLWQTMMSTDNYSKYLSDGLHLSDEGNKLLGKCLEPHVRELTQHLPVMLPQWRDFKLSNFK